MKNYYAIPSVLSGILFFLFFQPKLNAQQYLGVITSNYAGIMGADLQPASIVDSRIKVDINLFSVNMSAWQNARYFQSDNMPKWWVKSFKTDTAWREPDSTFYSRNFSPIKNPDNKTRGINYTAQLDILNFMFHINPKIAIGVSIKSRINVSVSNLSPELIRLAETGLKEQSLWNLDLGDKLIAGNAAAWNEYGINYAQVAMDKNEHFIKVGGRLKFLQGIASAYIQSDKFSYRLDNQDTAAYLNGNINYGHSKDADQILNHFSLNNMFQLNSKLGVGADLGIVYEWRPKWKDYKYDMDGETNLWRRDKEKYTLRIGASVLDIGGMKFEKDENSRNFVADNVKFDLKNTFSNVKDFKSMDSTLQSNFQGSQDKGNYFMNLPTAASLQIDYHIWNDFYLNFTGYFDITSKKNPHNLSVPTQVSLTPSYDFKWFGIYSPLSWNNYSGFKAGLGARLGPITVGFTDWNSLLAKGKVRGTAFYFGLRLPILYTKPHDLDGDKVSDKKDMCVEIPGVWRFKGCPDTDNDSIPDTEDACPSDSGLIALKGCPDRDGDGIPDKDDYCPDDAGPKIFNGCPDKDHDSIIDRDDKCPDVFGLKEYSGCPDTDGDSIPDPDDACPTVAGPKENNGCPDTDGDGILDYLDNCPTQYGPAENNGCPWPDTDGDGLLDKDDKCPYIKGPVKNQGCPYDDTDNDGIIDAEDQCPQTPGVVENHGCPEVEKEVQEVLKTAFDNLEFFTGNAIIKEESKPSLTELANVLIKKPEWKLQISGHTDNVGASQANLILSKKRAEAVRDFLVEKGVDKLRLNVLFFGETQPIADNNTDEGRQKNRRVEMTIVFD
jgi:outer membrane protein OmpA-like peptidoglycan-associated protein